MSNTLTPKAEEILKEILDHRDEKGNCDLKYWEKKFNDYSFTETSLYCDGFRELKNDDLITVKWAEGCPYILFPTNKGLSHFEQKKQAERMKRKEKQRKAKFLLARYTGGSNRCGIWRHCNLSAV